MTLLMTLLLSTMAADWPNPLGEPPVTTREAWESERRPKLLAAFQREMYGQYPTRPDHVAVTVLHEDAQAFGGKATLREVALTLAPDTPPVHWLIVIPNKQPGPVPAFVGLNFSGNHTLVADPKVRIPTAWFAPKRRDTVRNSQKDAWPIETIVDAGFAVATAYYGEVVPDDPNESHGLSKVLRPQPAPADGSDTGAVIAWAWGLARGADYVATLGEVNRHQMIAVGHSRLGKAALVSAAFDPIFSAVIANQAGCGGSAPSRTDDPKAETVARINKSFPHWFCANFKAYGADPSKLPFDQHSLVALCAPKRVLFTAATGDQWANPTGQLEVLKGAAPVYRLYGFDEMLGEYPKENQQVGDRLAFWVRPGAHAMSRPDWAQYLAWAKQVIPPR